eukprot:UN12250
MLAGCLPLGIVVALILSAWKMENWPIEAKAVMTVLVSICSFLTCIALFIVTAIIEAQDDPDTGISAVIIGCLLFLVGFSVVIPIIYLQLFFS